MKRLAMLLVLLSVSMFALGCSDTAKQGGTDTGTGGTTTPSATEPVTPPAETPAPTTPPTETPAPTDTGEKTN